MFKNLTQLYALIVCLVSILILMINLGFLLNATSEIIFMDSMNRSSLSSFDSNETYQAHITKSGNKEKIAKLENLSTSEIEKERIMNYVAAKKEIKYSAIRKIINCGTWILVTFLFFIFHWRLHKRSLFISNEKL